VNLPPRLPRRLHKNTLKITIVPIPAHVKKPFKTIGKKNQTKICIPELV